MAAVLTRARLRSTRVRHRIPPLLPTARPRAIRRPLRAVQPAAAQIRRVVQLTRATRLRAAGRAQLQVTRLRVADQGARRQATRRRAAVPVRRVADRDRRQAVDRARRRADPRQAADREQQRAVRRRADVREEQGVVRRTPAGATWVAAHLPAGMFLSRVEDRQTFVPMDRFAPSIAVACTLSTECGAGARW